MADTPVIDPIAFKKFEHDGWADVASTYRESFARATLPAIDPLLDAALAGPGARLLDVACGPGIMSAAAAERGATPVGLDYVQGMVEEAQRFYPGIQFRQGDAESLPFEDASFDTVVSNFGIIHFPEPEKAIAEAYRVLQPGGRIAFTAWAPPERSPLMGLVYGAIMEHADLSIPLPPGPAVFLFGDHEECRRILTNAGFAGVEAKDIPGTVRFSGVEGVTEMFDRGTARTKGLLKRQSDDIQRKIAAVIAAGAKDFERDGTVEIPMPAVLASGQKP